MNVDLVQIISDLTQTVPPALTLTAIEPDKFSMSKDYARLVIIGSILMTMEVNASKGPVIL
jgi:hypothetical protein